MEMINNFFKILVPIVLMFTVFYYGYVSIVAESKYETLFKNSSLNAKIVATIFSKFLMGLFSFIFIDWLMYKIIGFESLLYPCAILMCLKQNRLEYIKNHINYKGNNYE